ncbi:hypothetical protein NX059_007442 [Plenodomus lindquistii]|nr:hypothetical protein NX059_007442 [Plenodomus lindquistii]
MHRASIIAAVAAFSSTVLAQGNLLSQIPQCAQACFGSNLGSCGPLDIACICGNAPVINSVSCCVFATCPQSDIESTISFATNLCSLQNVQVDTTPDCPANGTSSASASASAASTASAVSASASASGAAASASASASRTAASGSASAAASTAAAAPLQQTGTSLGLGAVMAILFAYL